jgi:putative phosphoesterase
MVRVAVVSDTHGDLRHLDGVKQQLGQVDWLLHAGDHFADVSRVAAGLGVPIEQVRAVVGNCDFPASEPALEILELAGVRILLVHGHQFRVKSTVERILSRAQAEGARVAIFGHSHVALDVDAGGVLLFNPGSLSLPNGSARPSCGLLELDAGAVLSARHIFA